MNNRKNILLIRATDFYKKMKSFYYDGSVATIGEITASGTNTTSYSSRQTVAGEPDAYKITVTDPQGNQTVNYYSGDGQLYRSEGAAYPVAYTRNAAGQMEQLYTWRNENGDPDITRWYYDPYTGSVTDKLYADSKGTSYTYLGDGRIFSREWARGITTTYGYTDTASGSIRTTEHSDSTPSVTNYYNLAGQLVKVEDGTGANTFSYDALGRQTAETNALAVITRSYDTYGRYTGYILNPVDPVHPVQKITYGYDSFNRISTVISIIGTETNAFTYSYLPGSQLNSGYTVSTGGTASPLSVIQSYEADRNLVTAVSNLWNTSVISSFDYSNDSRGRRTVRIDTNPSLTATNTFGYNVRNEVTNVVMNSSEQSIVYDDIGNRLQSTVDSDQSSATNIYTANQLNQYTSVNSAGSARNITHDLDGNLTSDGHKWNYSYDGENRLVKSEPYSVTNGSVMFEYRYNHKNLRVEKVKKQLSGREAGYPMNPEADPGTWAAIETRKYIWDGFNIAAEIIIDHVTPATNMSYYTWGIDLSGTLQGAGGVSGLLSETKVSDTGTNVFYSVSDANGNITEYVDATGAIKAHYEYNSAGEITDQTGAMADDFTHRFSTKPFDKKTHLVLYQYRPYDALNARFISKDPMEEDGGKNLYVMNGNDVINKWDYLGLKTISVPKCHGRLILGHTSKRDPIHWEFPDGCAYGGVVGCWPGQNNPTNQVNRWPNVPTHNERMFEGCLKRLFGSKSLQYVDFSTDYYIGGEELETDFTKAVENALSQRSFNRIVDNLCDSPCCCDEIVLVIQVTKGGWEIENGVKQHSLKPRMTVTIKGKCQ